MSSFYTPIGKDADLEQGDIFTHLPFLELNSTSVVELVVEGNDYKHKETDIINYIGTDNQKRNIVVPATIQPGIIITQNCDILRSDYVSYCAIRKYEEVEKNFSQKQKAQIEFLTGTYKNQAKYFYLPPDILYGFKERMAVDFSAIHQIRTEVLLNLREKRLNRIQGLPLDHFREKLAFYFKRFAYDSWYILTKEEFDSYLESKKDKYNEKELSLIQPLPWQKSS